MELKFDEKGLIPVIVQDINTGEILMQAYANQEAIDLTVKTGNGYFFSRSRNALWMKGETSSHILTVYSILVDCDMDSLIYLATCDGPACHTNNKSCFYRVYKQIKETHDYKILFDVLDTIYDRKKNPKEGSYTNYLYGNGISKICKKVGEEATETVISAIANDKENTVMEICDLYYHIGVLMSQMDIKPEEIIKELEKREGKKPKEKYKDLNSGKRAELD